MSKRVLMGLLLGLSITSLAGAGVVAIENSGGVWSSQEVLAGDYSSVAFNTNYTTQFVAVGPNGADAIYKTDAWHTMHASNTAYTDVVCNRQSGDQFIAPRVGGGVDFIPWNSSQDTGVTGTFTKVAKNHTVSAPNCYFGLNSAGEVNEILYSGGGWHTAPTTGTAGYTQIASNNCENQVFGLNSNGISLVAYWKGAWGTFPVTNGAFSLLTGDDQKVDTAYAAGPNGLPYIHPILNGFGAVQVSDKNYTAITPIVGSTIGFFGALASGGIEKVTFNADGTNVVTETVLTNGNFSYLINDWTSPSLLMGIQIPEPATMILLSLGGLLLRKRS